MKEPEHFGEMLREMRQAYGHSQEKMAEMVELSSRQYARIERGECRITVETFHSYAKLFNKQLLIQTGYVLDERFSAKDIYIKAAKILERIFVGGK
jgi:transcriptional regulator with XRE-family HTH domain